MSKMSQDHAESAPERAEAAEDEVQYLRMVIEELRTAARTLLDVIAEPNQIVQDHYMDNALQAMADAIERSA